LGSSTSSDMQEQQPVREGPFLVSRVTAEEDLRSAIEEAVRLVGGWSRVTGEGEIVTIKPNLNTADPYPASSDPMFIKALGEALLDAGVERLRIMDSSTVRVSTRKVAETNSRRKGAWGGAYLFG